MRLGRREPLPPWWVGRRVEQEGQTVTVVYIGPDGQRRPVVFSPGQATESNVRAVGDAIFGK